MKSYFFIVVLLLCTVVFKVANGQAGLFIRNGAQLYSGDSIRIVLQNMDFSNNGILSATAGSRFVFAGNTGTGTLSGTAISNFGDIEIKRPGGTLQLNASIGVLGNCYFAGGDIDLNGYSITLDNDPGGQLINENAGSHITGNTGFVRKTMLLNAPVNTDPGKLGLSFSSSQNLGPTLVERYHYSVNGQSIHRVFRIVPANNTSLDATLQLQYLDAELNGLDEQLLTAHTSTAGSTWTNKGGTNNTAANLFTITGLNELAWITLAYANAALPVKFSTLEVNCTAGKNILHWQTAQEVNSNYFKIESSGDGLSWQTDGKLPAKGNSSTPYDYYYSANNAKYYRLQAVDKDGSFIYTHIMAAACVFNEPGTRLYPNPAQTFTNLIIRKTTPGHIQVKLVNSHGQMIWQQQVLLQNNSGQLRIPLAGIAAGIYYVHVQDDTGKQVFKLLKQ
jgi:Secretion system C-terminal sorting domain